MTARHIDARCFASPHRVRERVAGRIRPRRIVSGGGHTCLTPRPSVRLAASDSSPGPLTQHCSPSPPAMNVYARLPGRCRIRVAHRRCAAASSPSTTCAPKAQKIVTVVGLGDGAPTAPSLVRLRLQFINGVQRPPQLRARGLPAPLYGDSSP